MAEETVAKTIPILDFVLCLSEAVDLISKEVSDHHKRTAQICYSLGLGLGLPDDELRDLIIAAALHDVGGLTRSDRLSALDFEYQDPFGHAIMGYLLLREFKPFERVANIVRYHHVPWENGDGATFTGEPVPMLSHLLQVADRVAVLIDPNVDVLMQAGAIVEKVESQAGSRFVPEHVECLKRFAKIEYFWLDALFTRDVSILGKRLSFPEISLEDEDFLGVTNLFRRIIDFRSRFTASHSAGVAAVSGELAARSGFSRGDVRVMLLAGLLHDLGKLAIPAEILEKPGKLTEEEFDLMKRHTYYTFHLLEPLRIMDVIRQWGAFHHERLDGLGYPFHVTSKELPLGSRIVAVADVFTALTEDRPYRAGMSTTDAYQIIREMVGKGNLDNEVAETLGRDLDVIDEVRKNAQKSALKEYDEFTLLSEEFSKGWAPKSIPS